MTSDGGLPARQNGLPEYTTAVAPALGPEEVERQITYPIEQGLSGLPGIEQMRSISKFGLSQVVRRRFGILSDAKGLYARLTARENVDYFGRLYGIAKADEAAKDEPAATKAYQQLLTAWPNADATLPQLKAAHAWLDLHRAEGAE